MDFIRIEIYRERQIIERSIVRVPVESPIDLAHLIEKGFAVSNQVDSEWHEKQVIWARPLLQARIMGAAIEDDLFYQKIAAATQ